MLRNAFAFLLLVFLTACTSSRPEPADLILTGGRIFTGLERAPWVEAIAIRGETVASTGTSAQIATLAGPATRVVDLAGRVVIPGINDAHVHAPWISEPVHAVRIPREGVSKEILLDAVRKGVADAPEGRTVQAELPLALVDSGLTRDDLDAISTTRPIRLAVFGGHSAILNTPALRAWGIAENASDPSGGWYGRREGRLTGWLYEHAYWLPQRRYLLGASDEEILNAIRAFEREALSYGITSVQTFPLAAQRTTALLPSALPVLRWRVIDFRMAPYVTPQGRGPVKYILDGTPIERSAAMLEPYADDPSKSGQLNYTLDEIAAMVSSAASGGGQLHVHAVGDRAIAAVLDAMERTKADWPSLRVRIEHGDNITPAQAARAKALGVMVVQNPAHFTIPETMKQRYAQRAGTSQLARSLVAGGNRFALGSDGPLNPFLNMFFAAIHPTNPAESLTVEQSLRALTRGAAEAEFEEGRKGTLEPGKLADLAVLSQDIFAIAPQQLPDTRSVMTIVGGQVVWEQP